MFLLSNCRQLLKMQLFAKFKKTFGTDLEPPYIFRKVKVALNTLLQCFKTLKKLHKILTCKSQFNDQNIE